LARLLKPQKRVRACQIAGEEKGTAMQDRRRPTVIGIAACLVALWTVGITGCATEGPPSFPGRPMENANKITFEIRSTTRAVATIYINDEERGDTPVFIRTESDSTGGTAEDLVIKAVWAGMGGNDVEFTIPRGSRPQSVVHVGPNGERDY
jgi:hypothetical protein